MSIRFNYAKARRSLAYVLVTVGAWGIVAAAYLAFPAGRVNVARQLVRLESSGQKTWPVKLAKFILSRVAIPVRAEIRPGVSLLLDPRDLVSATILVSGEWQPGVWRAISSGLSNGAVFLDVGAHIGYDSLRASLLVGESGRVVAFEPNPNTLKLLRDNIAASHAGNVIVQAIACTDTEQTLTLFDATPTGNSGASSLSRDNANERGNGGLPSYSVRGRPIDNVVAELGLRRVDVVKVDVEGAEYSVILGAREMLRRFHPKLIVEVRRDKLANFGVKVEDLTSLIKDLGYNRSVQVDDDDWEWTVE